MLIVSVTCDESVTKEKGKERPVFKQAHRVAMLRAMTSCVDGVLVVNDALDALQKVKPAIFVKGSDYLRKVDAGSRAFCAANGIEIMFTDELTFSSTKLLKHYAESGRR